MAKSLSPKLRKWLKCYLDETSPETFGNAAACARAAGYKCTSDASFENLGMQNYKRLLPQIEQWLDENELSDVKLKQKLVEGLNALETKFFSHLGEVTAERTVIPWEFRRRYLEMAMKVKGLFSPEKYELSGKDGAPIDVKFDDAVSKEDLRSMGDRLIEEILKR